MPIKSSNIVLFFRIMVGNVRVFVVQVLALSFLMALIAGPIALENALENAYLIDSRSPYIYLFLEAFNEIHTLSLAWQFPAWALVVVAVYVTGLHSVEALKHLSIILMGIGASKQRILLFIFARTIVLSLFGWFLGVSIGLTFSQVAFRILAFIFNGPYEVPILYSSDLLQFALLSLVSVFFGSMTYTIKILKTQPREVLE